MRYSSNNLQEQIKSESEQAFQQQEESWLLDSFFLWTPTFSLFQTQSDNMSLDIWIQPKQY